MNNQRHIPSTTASYQIPNGALYRIIGFPRRLITCKKSSPDRLSLDVLSNRSMIIGLLIREELRETLNTSVRLQGSSRGKNQGEYNETHSYVCEHIDPSKGVLLKGRLAMLADGINMGNMRRWTIKGAQKDCVKIDNVEVDFRNHTISVDIYYYPVPVARK